MCRVSWRQRADIPALEGGNELEARGLHKQREAAGTWGTCCASLLEMKTMGGKGIRLEGLWKV